MTTPTDLCKEALAWTGTRTTITSINDGSPEANYCLLLYAPLRDFLLREGDYDFALVGSDVFTAGGTPGPLWNFIYQYPLDCIRIRQLIPTAYNKLDPVPVEWNVGTIGTTTRVILTHVGISKIIYTRAVSEDLWDAIFRESFVRLLSSALAFAITNRIEASDKMLKEAISFAGIANLRDS